MAYIERDVSRDRTAIDELIGLGFNSTPVILIDGQAVVGFNEKQLRALLGLG